MYLRVSSPSHFSPVEPVLAVAHHTKPRLGLAESWGIRVCDPLPLHRAAVEQVGGTGRGQRDGYWEDAIKCMEL